LHDGASSNPTQLGADIWSIAKVFDQRRRSVESLHWCQQQNPVALPPGLGHSNAHIDNVTLKFGHDFVGGGAMLA
jgi:hypothetical protein